VNIRLRLFTKYVALFAAVVCVALLTSGSLETWFNYRDHKAAFVRIQREQAEAAAAKIGQFIKGIEDHVGWTTQLPWIEATMEQRRMDALRLLRQVPPITEFSALDDKGREQLRVSRLALDIIRGGADLSNDPRFVEAMANKVHYGPVYFRRGSEPYMTLALAGVRRDAGVSVADVNLTFVWDLISQIKVGERGQAYIVNSEGRLIAHPDLSLVLRNTDLSGLAQVQAARATMSGASAEPVQNAQDIQRRQVLTAYAPIAGVGWLVFVELPVDEAYAPLYATVQRIGLVLLAELALAFLAGMFLARRMIVPIQALRTGAARIGGGDLGQRISVKTGDELEALADQFNDMAGKLQDSYSDLEDKVQTRTHELAQSVSELRALGEISQAVNSTLDLDNVLKTIVIKAVQLSGTEAGAIYIFDEVQQRFLLRTTQGLDQETTAALLNERIDLSNAYIASAIKQREPFQIPDMSDEASTPVNGILLRGGFRALLVAPLLQPDRVLGLLVVRRKEPGLFATRTIDLLKTFAAQSVLAIQNARLFQELEEKSQQLEIASQHKSQFLANMSHELRTPLNAVLGYTELILNNVYGEPAERMRVVVGRVRSNGKHLLKLINDVLDLSKIEAGQLTLSLADFSMKQVVESVYAAVEPLAAEKQLALKVELSPNLPRGHGDDRRLTQVLLNLVGNAIKFTDAGEVAINASAANGTFTLSVRDTGPGIDPADQDKIFEEFRQSDSSATKKKGGTGLGLSIARRIVEMHDGRIWVESSVGSGATFFFSVPVHVGQPMGPV
jgi:signal transduction histidine kinase